jgi:hypothetical protein
MTQRFTVHELRPVRGARPREPAPAAAEPGDLDRADQSKNSGKLDKAKETGGPSGPEPTRYGDWERKGICVDF